MTDGSFHLKTLFANFTGNPYVDAGMWAICELASRSNPEHLTMEDLRKARNEIVDLYVTDGWRKSLYSVFPNSPITNPAVREKGKKLGEFLDSLLEDIDPLDTGGSCVACGRRNHRVRSTRMHVPMTGSGDFLNYFPHAADGADYCSACVFCIQFSPLVTYSCGRMLLLHSNSENVMKYWVKEPIKEVRRQISMRDYSGCPRGDSKNPRNALFSIISRIQEYSEVRWVEESPTLTFYHFTNWNQGPDINVYYLPTPVFRFLAYVKRHYRHRDWIEIVKGGYAGVKWEKNPRAEEFVNKKNEVYDRLLDGRSIVRYFFSTKMRNVYGDWGLLSLYLAEVRGMEKERIGIIRRVGDEIADLIRQTGDIRRLEKLERSDTYGALRNQLRIIIKERIRLGASDPLFSLDEYVDRLFPSYDSWRETQDLLLYRIYEDLHDWLVTKRADLTEARRQDMLEVEE